ncbi:hypothetical protein GCM10018771_68470 [Streptomyces cellulosae]|nr:hypothetical protein GCM10018771_68470 [Streptomyces cellulosae]
MERLLFDTLAALMPGPRAVLRRIADAGGTATYDDIQAHFAGHPDTAMPRNRIGGTLTFVRAVRRRIGPDNTSLLELGDRIRVYRIEPALIEGLQRAFALADARSDQRKCMCRSPDWSYSTSRPLTLRPRSPFRPRSPHGGRRRRQMA